MRFNFSFILEFPGYIAGFPQIMISSRPFIWKDGAIAGQVGKCVCARQAGHCALGRVSQWVEVSHPAGPPHCRKVSCSKYVPAGGRWESPKPRCRSRGSSCVDARPGRRRWSACAWAPCRRRHTSRGSWLSATAALLRPTGPLLLPSVCCGPGYSAQSQVLPAGSADRRTLAGGNRRGRWIAQQQMLIALHCGIPPPPAVLPPPLAVLPPPLAVLRPQRSLVPRRAALLGCLRATWGGIWQSARDPEPWDWEGGILRGSREEQGGAGSLSGRPSFLTPVVLF